MSVILDSDWRSDNSASLHMIFCMLDTLHKDSNTAALLGHIACTDCSSNYLTVQLGSNSGIFHLLVPREAPCT